MSRTNLAGAALAATIVVVAVGMVALVVGFAAGSLPAIYLGLACDLLAVPLLLTRVLLNLTSRNG